MKKIENLLYGQDTAQALDLYIPDGDVSAMFVYFHGGGLDHGDKGKSHEFASYLAGCGIAVASANYRMYPTAKYPDFICDAAAAVAFANRFMREELGCDRLYVGGSSAGGYLSMMLCFDKRYLLAEGLDNSKIAGYFHDAGQPTAHFAVLKNSGVDPRRVIIDETAPLYYMGLMEKYPPMRFIVSDNDMKNRYEQTMLVLSTLSHFGYTGFDHIVMNGKHCHYCHTEDENGNPTLGTMIYDFIEKSKTMN